MVFHIITIFPHIFDSYFNEGVLKRAQKKGLISIKIHNLRDFTDDERKTVDDRPFGGGPGMVLKVEPIYKAVESIKQISKKENSKHSQKNKKQKTILLSAKGDLFNQKTAESFSKLNEMILICGRYEGVDERVAKHIADKEISIGNYILSGGELGAMVIIDTVSRLIPVCWESSVNRGKAQSIAQNKLSKICFWLSCLYRPEIFSKWRVPKVLLSGDHKKLRNGEKNIQTTN